MICRDCIHYEVCDIQVVINSTVDGGDCKYFKDSSKYIEVPCAVGDKVYYIFEDKIDENAINGFVISDPLKITEVGTKGFWTSGYPNEEPNAMDDFEPWESIGKTVFLTKEAAEQALRESENK